MILLTLRDYIKQRGQVSLRDLVLHFQAEPEVLKSMLAHLIRKKQIRYLPAPNGGKCGGCTQCDSLTLEIYQWVDENQPL